MYFYIHIVQPVVFPKNLQFTKVSPPFSAVLGGLFERSSEV
jgi:hypothetical protein